MEFYVHHRGHQTGEVQGREREEEAQGEAGWARHPLRGEIAAGRRQRAGERQAPDSPVVITKAWGPATPQVSLVFQKIELENKPGKKSAVDNWLAQT